MILSRLKKQGRVISADLAEEFGISEDTVRRDLRDLAEQGHCTRVYGGALLASDRNIVPLMERITDNPQRKIALARAAISNIPPNSTIFIDAGSTNLAITEAIPQGIALNIITNAPLLASSLMSHADIDVIVIGGRLDHKSGAVLGARAMQEIELYRPDLCILGSCGLDAETGISASFLEEAEFKRFIARQSGRVLAAVTNEKLGCRAPFGVVETGPHVLAIVEHDADERLVASLEDKGTSIIRARE